MTLATANAASWRSDMVPAILRVAIALTFTVSGLERVVRGSAYATAYFSSLGIAWPAVTGPAVSWLELVAGLAVLVGAVTRIAAGLLAADMVVALAVVRVPVATSAPSFVDAVVAVRFEVLVLATALVLVILGAGKWSVDYIVGRHGVRGASRPGEDAA